MEDSQIKELDRLDYLYNTLEWVMQQPYQLNLPLVEQIKNNLNNISLEKVKALREMVLEGGVRPVEESQLADIEGLPAIAAPDHSFKREIVLKNEKKEYDTVLFFDSNMWFSSPSSHSSSGRR